MKKKITTLKDLVNGSTDYMSYLRSSTFIDRPIGVENRISPIVTGSANVKETWENVPETFDETGQAIHEAQVGTFKPEKDITKQARIID